MEYKAQTFDIPALDGISAKSIEEHIGLYNGYVKNFNAMTALAGDLMKDTEKNALAIAELTRRRSFEFGGMRLHELYFPQFEGATRALDEGSALGAALKAQYTDAKYCMMEVTQVSTLRGPGWSLLYWDPTVKQFLVGFSGEQHMGHFATLPIVLALDVWEHAFLLDYGAQGKGKYVDAFFKNLNWETVEKRFASLQA
jgi:Fe-Mn family superoxide dismutase